MLSWQQVYFGVHMYSLWQGRALSSAFLIRLLLLRWWCLLLKWKISMVWTRRQKHRLGWGREGALQWGDSESACAVGYEYEGSDMWIRLSLCIRATSMKAEWHVTQPQPVQLGSEYQTQPVQLGDKYEGRVTCDSDSAWSMKAEWHVTQTQPGVWRQSDMWIWLSLCSWEMSIKAELHVNQTQPVETSMKAELHATQTQPVQLGSEHEGRVTCTALRFTEFACDTTSLSSWWNRQRTVMTSLPGLKELRDDWSRTAAHNLHLESKSESPDWMKCVLPHLSPCFAFSFTSCGSSICAVNIIADGFINMCKDA